MVPSLLTSAILLGGLLGASDPARYAAYDPDANYMADQGFERNASFAATAAYLADASFDADAQFDPAAGFLANAGLIRVEPRLELEDVGWVALLAEDQGWFADAVVAEETTDDGRNEDRFARLWREIDRLEPTSPQLAGAERAVLARLEGRERARRDAATARQSGDERGAVRADRREQHEATRLARAEARAATLYHRAATVASTDPGVRQLASIRRVLQGAVQDGSVVPKDRSDRGRGD